MAAEDIAFVSLGMVVLDELHLGDGTVLYDVPGGSGLYSTLGARLAMTGTPSTRRVGCFVLAGSDFPDFLEETLGKWDITVRIARDTGRLSTRGLIHYQGVDFNERTFVYTTPPLQPTPANLIGSPLLQSSAFHFLASPQKLKDFVSQLLELRTAHGISTQPLLVWEPAPASCDLANQAAHATAASLVDVYSPNHIEFLATFEHNSDDILRPSPPHLDRERIQAYALRLLDLGVGTHGKGAVVIRRGEHGCLVVSRRYPARWFPAFYNATSAKVVDATGAGNAFLGAFTITLGEMADLTEAAIAGCVAASFAIEQIGLPRSTEQDGKETWNAVQFSARVREYRAMLEA